MTKFLTVTLAALAIAVTAAGAVGATSTGPLDCFPDCRINILAGTPTTYPAGQPFVIRHGVQNVCSRPPQRIPGKMEFVLEIDGVVRPADVVQRVVASPPQTDFECPYAFLAHAFVFNFPNGMTGTHTFTGHWLEACEVAVEFDGWPGPCSDPAQQVNFFTESLTVTFTG